MNISNRIKNIVDAIQYETLADIGTDHGYIPIYACKLLKVKMAIACDINKGPLQNAKLNISVYNMHKQIETRLGSGLTPLQKGEVQTVTIAGMGGDLIIDILKASTDILPSLSQIIVQPQSSVSKVRKYMHSIGFKIINEYFIKEENKYYTVINCIKGREEVYSFAEYAFGKILIEKREPLFINFIKEEKHKFEIILNNIKLNNIKTNKVQDLISYIETCKEVL